MKSAKLNKRYAGYRTDKNKEKNGVERKYVDGTLSMKVARAGGSNDKYSTAFQKNWKEVNRVAELGELSDEKASEIYYQTYIETIISDVRFLNEAGVFVPGIGENDDGSVVPASPEELLALFRDCPELFLEIRFDAERRDRYLREDIETASKN